MYAIVVAGGRQVKVSEGDVLRVDKIDAEVGTTLELADVRMIANEDGIVVDPDALKDAKVVCTVTGQGRRKKIRVFKMKRRKNYHRSYGHRQHFTELKVQSIQA